VSQNKKLVICVDRDNDIGEKAGLGTPIRGKEALIAAATKLALADAEEADINAIFEAVRVYDRLRGDEQVADADVVLVAGDKILGIESDRKIGQQLDEVLNGFPADSAILVSDGPGDEWVMPLIQSRVKIDSVRRVVVKQNEPLENTFYVIKRLLEDPTFSRTFLPPFGIILFLLAVSLLLELSGKAIGIILAILGVYTVLKGLGRENLILEFVESVKQSLYSGKISFVTYIVALVLAMIGTSQGIMGYTELDTGPEEQILLAIAAFIKHSIWWYIGAILAPLIGKIMSMLIEREKIVRHWAILFSVIASGVILWGGSESIIRLSAGNYPLGYLVLFFSILGAVILSLIGVRISWYIRSTMKEKGEAECVAEDRAAQD
jgi:putative membrane protein